jgi:MoaA/NifB/PqqE/SkfB family radical SAM enzyme
MRARFFIQKEAMDKIQIANILLTRRCNLQCDYCSIVKNYTDMPPEYPNMNHYYKNELTAQQWINIIDTLHKNNPNVFLIFYGGEPFLYPGLSDLISHCHTKNMYYTIISNNTKVIQPKILDLYSKVGKIRGFSASVDPDLYIHMNNDAINSTDDAAFKTVAGFRNLCILKQKDIADDVVAEITVSKYNCKYLYETVKILSKNKIVSSITTLDLKKNPYYDFSTIADESLLVYQTKEIAEQFMKIMADETLLVHIPHMLIKLFNILPCEMKCNLCNDLTNVTIDSDGSFRLCLRIRGVNTPKIPAHQIINSDGKICPEVKEAIKSDYKKYCEGCNWTCLLFSEYYSSGIVEH